MLGGSEMALNPRLSPDGHLLAFEAMVGGLSQVAVMKPESGNWSVLTRDRDHGPVSTTAGPRTGRSSTTTATQMFRKGFSACRCWVAMSDWCWRAPLLRSRCRTAACSSSSATPSANSSCIASGRRPGGSRRSPSHRPGLLFCTGPSVPGRHRGGDLGRTSRADGLAGLLRDRPRDGIDQAAGLAGGGRRGWRQELHGVRWTGSPSSRPRTPALSRASSAFQRAAPGPRRRC